MSHKSSHILTSSVSTVTPSDKHSGMSPEEELPSVRMEAASPSGTSPGQLCFLRRWDATWASMAVCVLSDTDNEM